MQALITCAFICGPILGGFLNDFSDMREACLWMSVSVAGFLLVYTVFAIFVHCTVYEGKPVSLDDSTDAGAGLNRSRGGDELSRLLRTLTEDKSDRQSLIKRKKKKEKKNSDEEEAAGEIETLDDI